MNRGKFIVFEGLDGAGTTTQANLLVQYLEKKGIKSHYTAEPTDGPIGVMLRYILQGRLKSNILSENDQFDPKTVALLFAADRQDHIQNELEPLLNKGVWVISDRYMISSLVYQGMFTGETEWVKELNRFAIKPDLTFFFDIDGEVSFKRLHSRTHLELYEKRQYMCKLSKRYQQIVSSLDDNTIINIDAEKKIEQINTDIIKNIGKMM